MSQTIKGVSPASLPLEKSQEVDFLSDVARLFPRCPRCGYGLRLVRGYWWCDVCRIPLAQQKVPSIREFFRAAEERLRRFLQVPAARRATPAHPGSTFPELQRRRTLARCPACGALTPRDLPSCVHCGTVFGQPIETPLPQPARPVQPPQHDDIVYRYIVENKGEISLSKASADLRIAMPELQASIRRLEGSGRIMRDGSREGS